MNAVFNHASPEATAARRARQDAAAWAALARAKALCDAMAAFRKHGIQTEDEFIAALSCLSACTEGGLHTTLGQMKNRLVNLLTDFDAELNEGEPELSAFASVGELDAQARFQAIQDGAQADARAIVRGQA